MAEILSRTDLNQLIKKPDVIHPKNITRSEVNTIDKVEKIVNTIKGIIDVVMPKLQQAQQNQQGQQVTTSSQSQPKNLNNQTANNKQEVNKIIKVEVNDQAFFNFLDGKLGLLNIVSKEKALEELGNYYDKVKANPQEVKDQALKLFKDICNKTLIVKQE